MTAAEARKLYWKTHTLPKIVEKIKEAINKGAKNIFISCDKLGAEVLQELGYEVTPKYNNDYEMKVEGYGIYW